ncbi:cation diffusion facilitator family transporter [Parablautia intestinalis]|uniref:cation diffusion facilitator family transporter n=1 Tax=Parablautia intestinalis TaxID=2320100 RepID=UPI00256EAAEF|nr:cation diffusion facilitator family transporter [Parablautia intestinalis]MCI8615079.1 cation transporter [Lachnospiraceae bacterium]
MVSILAKLLIKDYKNTANTKVRQAYGMLCGAVGIVLNIFLFLVKFISGQISGSIAITADAFNNLSDAGSSIITLVGFRMAGQKPDNHHPFGHGRIEYIAGLLVAVIILLMGAELFKSSVGKILHPDPIDASPLVLFILAVSICVKLYMFLYNSQISKKIDSAAMMATAKDSISDSFSTLVVLFTTLLAFLTDIQIDGWCGILVAIFVFWTGIGAMQDTVSPLLGQPPEPGFVKKVEEIIMEYKKQGVIGIHDLVVHNYGPGRVMLSVHVEVPSSGDILVLHDMIDLIEHRLAGELNCSAVIHMDPVCVDDKRTNKIKGEVAEIVKGMEGNVTFHDFRIVHGPTHTNLIFDVVVPFDYSMSDSEVVAFLRDKICQINEKYIAVIEVDKAYV